MAESACCCRVSVEYREMNLSCSEISLYASIVKVFHISFGMFYSFQTVNCYNKYFLKSERSHNTNTQEQPESEESITGVFIQR